MISNEQIWTALESVARDKGWSLSGFARRAGLDPTSLNPSKRTSAEGRPHWLSTGTLAKLLDAADIAFGDFARLVEAQGQGSQPQPLSGRRRRRRNRDDVGTYLSETGHRAGVATV